MSGLLTVLAGTLLRARGVVKFLLHAAISTSGHLLADLLRFEFVLPAEHLGVIWQTIPVVFLLNIETLKGGSFYARP